MVVPVALGVEVPVTVPEGVQDAVALLESDALEVLVGEQLLESGRARQWALQNARGRGAARQRGGGDGVPAHAPDVQLACRPEAGRVG